MSFRTMVALLLGFVGAARAARPSPIGAAGVRRRARHDWRRCVGFVRRRGPRLLQLHRLRSLRAADAADRRHRRGNGGPSPHAAWRDAHGERRRRRPLRALRAFSAVGRSEHRHQRRPGTADIRRVRPTDLCQRQSPHWLSPGVSIPDVVAAGCDTCQRRRAPQQAVARLAAALHRRRHGVRSRRPARERVSMGYRCASARRRPQWFHQCDSLHDNRHAVNPLFNDDNNGRQFAGRIQLRPVTGLIVGTSAAHGPFITDALARSVAVDDAGNFTQSAWGADAEHIRAPTIWSGSRRS